ncbi:hypothetical protein [Lysobacter sp. Root690]|uniref:hypothetical protein n=1 Tax=Lysobacter sp. Root690 TaxID=1736588 RepID=UPI000A53E445|nr:hypothetical protein [Lysobacter sp. Root690]
MKAGKGLLAAFVVLSAGATVTAVSDPGAVTQWTQRIGASSVAETRATPLSAASEHRSSQVSIDLSLNGEIAGLASANEPVTATVIVGGRLFPAIVQGATYTASINALNDAEMVTVEVVSTRARYRSVLGSAGKLQAVSGGDGDVTLAERASLRVSPFSTALAWLVRMGLEGRDAASDSEFETMTRSIVGNDLMMVAYLLDAFASGAVALPQGYQDGQQLLEAPAAYAEFLWTQDFYPASQAYLFSQADYVPFTSLAQLPDLTAMLAPLPINEPAVSLSELQLLYRQSDGSFALFEEEVLVTHPRYTAAINGQGELSLTPVGEAGTRNVLRYLPFSLFQPLPVHRVSRGHTLRRLVVGDEYSLWASRSLWSDSHISPAGQFAEDTTTYAVWSAFDLNAASLQYPWGQLLGDGLQFPTYSLPSACTWTQRAAYQPGFGKCAHAPYWFRYGHGGSFRAVDGVGERMEILPSYGVERSFSYQLIGNGALQVVRGNTPMEPGTDSTFWRYAAGSEASRPLIYLARAAGGYFVGASVAMVEQPGITLGSPVGSWRTPASEGRLARYPAARIFEIRRFPDGSGRDVNILGNQVSSSQTSWNYPTGSGVPDYSFRALFPNRPTSFIVANCTQAFATGAETCAPSRVRYFRPLYRVGARLYGVSDFYSNDFLAPAGYTGPYQVQLLDSRADYIECIAGDCLASVPPTGP